MHGPKHGSTDIAEGGRRYPAAADPGNFKQSLSMFKYRADELAALREDASPRWRFVETWRARTSRGL